MFTHKDIKYRSLFVIDCIRDRSLRVSNGELLLEDLSEKKTLTKLPFQKILALFVIGHISITTPLIEKCKKFNVALIVVTPSLRPVFFWALSAEGNFLLRQNQVLFPKSDLSVAKHLVYNKIKNQYGNLKNTRCKDELTLQALDACVNGMEQLFSINDYNKLMGIEGRVAKLYFSAYFQKHDWNGRKPRLKSDMINSVLDIGYTILFNYIEIFVRMFGFDPYIGVYHRLWYKRKSLICDLIEPFRCIIDKIVRKGLHLKQIKKSDFKIVDGMSRLKIEKNTEYCTLFYSNLILYKMDVFKYVQAYYRCFMQRKSIENYPMFVI